MIRFEKLSVPETIYPYVDAESAGEYINGTFGTIADDVFTAGEGTMAIMQIERGDDMKTDKFTVKTGERVRVADFSKAAGQIVNITTDELPETYAKDNALVADTDGKLKVGTGDVSFKVIEVTRYGVRAVVEVTAE